MLEVPLEAISLWLRSRTSTLTSSEQMIRLWLGGCGCCDSGTDELPAHHRAMAPVVCSPYRLEEKGTYLLGELEVIIVNTVGSDKTGFIDRSK